MSPLTKLIFTTVLPSSFKIVDIFLICSSDFNLNETSFIGLLNNSFNEASLKELFNSPINEVSFKLKSEEQIKKISTILKDEGKTVVNINLVKGDNILQFRLKNPRKLDRKSLNLLRNQEIQAIIN